MEKDNTFGNNTLGKYIEKQIKLEKTTLKKTRHWKNNGFGKEHIEKNNNMFEKPTGSGRNNT